MTYLRNSIIATLVYYDVFDYPMTLAEIYGFLINPSRLILLTKLPEEITLLQILEELDKLETSKILGQKNGFYFLYGRDDLYDVRIYRQKIADQKWKKFLRYARWLRLAPFVRGFFACGSMALGNTTPKSDFDVFVIGKSGRLYTCRFFLWLIASLLGVRRKPSDGSAPDKLCFNHYMTDHNMYLKYQSLYTAQLYSSLKPVYMPSDLFDEFFAVNNWIGDYLYNFVPQKNFIRRSIKNNRLIGFVAWSLEVVLQTRFGESVESYLKKYQQDRIMKNPLTGQPGGRVVCNDRELEFHPHSFESVVISKYRKGLERLGIVPNIKETDSGLTTQ